MTIYLITRAGSRFDVNNIASARVMEKAGMKFEGIQRSRIIRSNGRASDVKSCAIIKKDAG